MAYLASASGEPIPQQRIRELAATLGFSVPEDDLAALSTALRDQLASAARIETLDLSGVAPMAQFDPRWHD